jgi:hypothetical protein
MTAPGRTGTGWLLLLMLVSGNPSVYALFGGEEYLLPIVAALLGCVVITRRVHVLGPRVVPVSVMLLGILVVQCALFQFWPVATILGLATRLFIAAAVVALVDDFPAAYIRAISIVAGYCVVMWTIDQATLALGVDFRALFMPLEHVVGMDSDHRFSLVYTFTVLEGTYRNAGFFREPGLFAGYLLLGLLWLMLDQSGIEPRVRRQRVVVVLVALLTTVSTAGYVTIPLVLAAVAFKRSAHPARAVSRKLVFVAVLLASLVGLWLVSENTTFLEEKLQLQYQGFVDEKKNYQITRFGAALLDFEAISERPFLGWGLHESTKFALTPDLTELSPSGGVTGWARSYGLVGLVVFLLAIGASLRPLIGGSLAAAIYATAVIVVIAQPNTFLNYPAFLALMFLRRPRPPPDPALAEPRPEPLAPAHPPGGLRSRPS